MRDLLMVALILLSACATLPKEKLSQFTLEKSLSLQNDTLRIYINNSLRSPVRVYGESKFEELDSLLKQHFPITISALRDTSIYFHTLIPSDQILLNLPADLGDLHQIYATQIAFPFPKGKKYKIIQGYNGKFSHTSDYSRYALDFDLKVKDTICAAADGYVVGVVEGYKYGGDSHQWRDYSNYITIYHPEMNIFTQYAHLVHQGSFVEVGDKVEKHMPIGLAGKTGFTSIEHLHFNVLRANDHGLISMPIQFEEGYRGEDLSRGMTVSK